MKTFCPHGKEHTPHNVPQFMASKRMNMGDLMLSYFIFKQGKIVLGIDGN